MGYIYKITNDVNGKMYVGKTEQTDPYKRWKQHIQDSKRDEHKERPLYRAINKYGIEHFRFEVIEETNNTYEREQYWIDKLRTYAGLKNSNGYNATLGGEGKCQINLTKDEVVEYHFYEANCFVDDTAIHFQVSTSWMRIFLEENNIPYLKGNDIVRFKAYVEYGGIYQIHPCRLPQAPSARMYFAFC